MIKLCLNAKLVVPSMYSYYVALFSDLLRWVCQLSEYSETCLKDHLCNKSNSILRPQLIIIFIHDFI